MLADRALVGLLSEELEVEFEETWHNPVLSNAALLQEVCLEHFEVVADLHIANLTELVLE